MAMRMARITRETAQLTSEPPPGVTCWADGDEAGSFLAEIQGPSGCPFEGGIFRLSVGLPARYPFEPPAPARLLTVETMNKGCWNPSFNVATVLSAVRVLMVEPNPDDALMAEVAAEYRSERATYDAKAREMTLRYATGQ